jgi:YidC/Oxa1 family membrane protein insertase
MPSAPPKADAQERTIVVENSLYRVEISNRGGVVKSWRLKKYMDDANPPQVLDVVHPKASEQVGGWPFAVVLDDQQMEDAANSGLFVAEEADTASKSSNEATSFKSLSTGTLAAPAKLRFSWSDGHLEVTKDFQFDPATYVVRVGISAKYNGMPVKAGVAWLGGFGDLTVTNPAPVETVYTYYNENGSLTSLPYKKLEGPEKWGPGIWQGGKEYAGIQDRYFTAAFLPVPGMPSSSIETRYWKVSHSVPGQGQGAPEVQEPVSEMAASTSAKPLALRVYIGPKDYDVLKAMNPPLQALVNFGWLEIIADPLFHGLKWIHDYIPNWGWSIVILTLVINMLLFPLRISGYRTTLKMQRVAPEIKQINDKYKKYKMNDPKRQEANKEIMAIYSREGINPVGGCVPQLLQLPIWYGLYRALNGTVELRHAPWFWWIKDLSAKDPYYILPILMGVSMYAASKMTPMTATDPQQQAMMKFMPIGMSVLFMVIPYPSGLAVYILTSGVVGIVQQWYLNRKHPAQTALPAAKPVRGNKKP